MYKRSFWLSSFKHVELIFNSGYKPKKAVIKVFDVVKIIYNFAFELCNQNILIFNFTCLVGIQ